MNVALGKGNIDVVVRKRSQNPTHDITARFIASGGDVVNPKIQNNIDGTIAKQGHKATGFRLVSTARMARAKFSMISMA